MLLLRACCKCTDSGRVLSWCISFKSGTALAANLLRAAADLRSSSSVSCCVGKREDDDEDVSGDVVRDVNDLSVVSDRGC